MGNARRRIEAKIRKRRLEVEDILKVAETPSVEMARFLEEIAQQHQWLREPAFPNLPLAAWARVTAEYCRGGHQALAAIGTDKGLFTFVLGLLESLGGDESLSTALTLWPELVQTPSIDLAAAFRLASSINLLALRLARRPEQPARSFLEGLLALAVTDDHRATTVYALRHFGNENTVMLILNMPPLACPFEDAPALAVRAIRRRLKEAQKMRSI